MRRFTVAVIVMAMLAAACGDDGGSSSDADASNTNPTSTTTAAPKRGGIVTIGQYSQPPGLDPILFAGSGTVGGNELSAIYDQLIRYNPDTQKYEPRTAQSLESNADFTQWTLKLRPGIKFGDGTDYNADAVKFSLERLAKEGNSGTRSEYIQFVDTLTVVDPLTVQFKLKLGWSGFPYLLSSAAGLVYSPAAFAKAGTAQAFNLNPVDAGAGPFKVKSYKPGEALELERNPNYFGGEVHLDGLKFVNLGGDDKTFDALKTGTLQAGMVNSATVTTDAVAQGFTLNAAGVFGGNMLLMNAGAEVSCAGGQPANLCTGKADGTKVTTASATNNVLVRRAVAAAVDPKVVTDRAYQGKASPSSAPFAGSVWNVTVPGPKFDLNQAKQLVTQAKAAGWDGKIRVQGNSTAFGSAWAQAVAPQLQAAGMEPIVDTARDVNGQVALVLVQRDWDIATWSLSILDDVDAPYVALRRAFHSSTKTYGYGSPDMDAALDLVRVADSDAKRTEAYNKVSEIWARDVPAHVITGLKQGLIMSPKLHGVERTARTMFLFSNAWLE